MRIQATHRRVAEEAAEQTGKLDLSDLDITTLPPEIAQLTRLHLSGTQVKDLRPIRGLSMQITNDIIDQCIASREAQYISRTQNAMGLLSSRIDALDTEQPKLTEALAQHTQDAPLLSEEALMAKKA